MITYRIASKDEITFIYALRKQVFVVEQGVPLELEIDEFDDTATHVAGLEDENIIACGRLVALKYYTKIGRVAVTQDKRGKGIGKNLMEYLVKLAESEQKPIRLDAQLYATQFYNYLGFVEEGDVFMDAGIQHINMVYRGKEK